MFINNTTINNINTQTDGINRNIQELKERVGILNNLYQDKKISNQEKFMFIPLQEEIFDKKGIVAFLYE